jgi:hypothetical protein
MNRGEGRVPEFKWGHTVDRTFDIHRELVNG